ncbi:MAG: PAP2 family protein [Bacteroidota bacterium]
MLNKFAKALSIVFHPLLMPTVGIFLLFHSNSILVYQSPELKKAVYIIVFLSTCLLPLSFMPFFLYNKRIVNLFMEERRERIIPFFVAVIMYFFAWYLIQRIPIADFLEYFILASALNVLVLLIITFWWKISAHMVGLGGIAGLLMALSLAENINLLPHIIIVIFVSGVVGSARLKLDAHGPWQILAGFFQGLIITFFLLIYL